MRVASRSTMTSWSAATGQPSCQTVARAPARARRIAAIATPASSPSASSSRLIVGSEATAPNSSGWARSSAASAKQSPPSAIAKARSSTVLPGSWIDRAARHGPSCSDNPCAKPLTCAVCISSEAPVEEISDSRPAWTRNPPHRLRFTYGVPSRSSEIDLRQANFLKQDRHFRALHADQNPTLTKNRGLAGGEKETA